MLFHSYLDHLMYRDRKLLELAENNVCTSMN